MPKLIDPTLLGARCRGAREDNACCGHGIRKEAYIRFTNGVVVKGFDVIEYTERHTGTEVTAMTDEIKPERIEELMNDSYEVEDQYPDLPFTYVNIESSELRTLLHVYQRVRGLPDDWRNKMKRLPTTDDPSANAARSATMLCADHLDRAIAEAGGEGNHAGS